MSSPARTDATPPTNALAVLISGGLDSAILLGDALRGRPTAQPPRPPETIVHPLYIRCGLAWETVELAYLRCFLAALKQPSLKPIVILDQPIGDVYGNHWSVTAQGVPDALAPDEDVFLPGRNVLLLAKPLIWCHLHGVRRLAMGSLGTNPFPDATPEFFRDFPAIVGKALAMPAVSIELPFGAMKKKQAMKLGVGLPLEHSFSCIDPADDLHCGGCNKCQERRQAFIDAEMPDPTRYRR